MYQFLLGFISCLSWIIGLFFLRFYMKVKDRFFLFFLVAFWIFSLERFIIAMKFINDENAALVYLLRLLGFLLILIAILDKNRMVGPRPINSKKPEDS